MYVDAAGRQRAAAEPSPLTSESLLAATEGALNFGTQPFDEGDVPGRVSMICPTTDERVLFHTQLYACFVAQRWADKELVVIDTGQTPSPFLERKASEDRRVVYRHFRSAGNLWSVGLKRNVAVALASGEVVAHFDDDDLYAPCYVERMMKTLGEAQGATLSAWYVCDVCTGLAAYASPETSQESWILGYGFSHIYRRRACLVRPFPHEHFGEDYKFLRRLKEATGGRVSTRRDEEGIVLHMQQGLNLSNSHGQHEVPWSELRRMPFAELPGFEHLLDSTCWDRATPSPFVSVGEAYQMYLRPTPCRREADLRSALARLGVPTASNRMCWEALAEDQTAFATFSVGRCGELFVEPGRTFASTKRFADEIPLPGDVPRTGAPEQAALLYLARILLRRCPPTAVPQRSGYTGSFQLQLRTLSHIAVLSTLLLLTRHFPGVRLEVNFEDEGTWEDPGLAQRQMVMRFLSEQGLK